MMFLCYSFASASFTSRNPSSLSVDRLNSKVYTICRLSGLIDCDPPIWSPAPVTIYEESCWIEVVPCLLTFFDWYCHLYLLCLLRQIFLAADFSKLFSSPQRAHVAFFVKRVKLELAFWLCAACMLSYRCLQMEWWAAVTVVAIPSQTALLMWLCVSSARPSVISPRVSCAILHSQHPADCILRILVRKQAVVVISATDILKCLLRFQKKMEFFCHSNHFPTWTFLHPVAAWSLLCPCAAERRVDASPLSLLLDTSPFESFFIHPCTCHRAVTILGS